MSFDYLKYQPPNFFIEPCFLRFPHWVSSQVVCIDCINRSNWALKYVVKLSTGLGVFLEFSINTIFAFFFFLQNIQMMKNPGLDFQKLQITKNLGMIVELPNALNPITENCLHLCSKHPPCVGFVCICFLSLGSFGWREGGGKVEESKVELAKNRLILSQIYSLLPLNSNRKLML